MADLSEMATVEVIHCRHSLSERFAVEPAGFTLHPVLRPAAAEANGISNAHDGRLFRRIPGCSDWSGIPHARR
jgi:hypothetical protein